MATIGSLVVDLVAQTSSFQADMGKAQAALNSAGARMNRVLSGVERGFGGFNRSVQQSIGGIFNLRGAVAGLLGGAGLGAIINGSLEAASAIDDVAQKAGVSAAFLQEMRFAASQNGASARDMDDAITRLNRRLGLFVTTGGGPAKQAIEALGLSVRDSSGQLRGSESIFEEVTGKLAALSSEAEKSALASQLFGEDAGPRLVQLLNQGADGIQGLRERAQSLGLVMDESLIRQAKSASDNLGALGQVIKTRVTVAVAQLAPQIDRLVTDALAVLPALVTRAGQAFEFLNKHMWVATTIMGAMAGAKLGAVFGPWGAAIGAVAGALGGAFVPSMVKSAMAADDTASSIEQVTDSANRLARAGSAGAGLAADLRKAQEEAAALLDRIDNRWLQSTGQQLALIEKRKAEELAALEATAASAEQKAAAKVKIEQSAAAEIAAIAKRGAEERARETERVAQEAARAEEKRQGFVDRVTQDYLQATGQQIALIERRRETELAALDQLVLSESAAATAREQIVAAAEARKSEIVTAEAERRQGIVQRIEAAWLQATGQQEALIQRRRDAELRMLEDIGLGEEQLARLRVMVNDTAAAEIADIHAREAEKLAKEQERAAQEAERGWERFGDRTKGVLEDLVQGGKLSLQGLISLADDALQAVLQASGAAGKGGGPGQSTGGLIGNAFASLLGFADGGRPPVGRASIVGERGPELFVPDRPGTIIPNDFGGGMGGGGMVVNIDARGAAPGVESLIRREMAALSASIEPRIDARVTRQAGRGGAFAKAVGRR